MSLIVVCVVCVERSSSSNLKLTTQSNCTNVENTQNDIKEVGLREIKENPCTRCNLALCLIGEPTKLHTTKWQTFLKVCVPFVLGTGKRDWFIYWPFRFAVAFPSATGRIALLREWEGKGKEGGWGVILIMSTVADYWLHRYARGCPPARCCSGCAVATYCWSRSVLGVFCASA